MDHTPSMCLTMQPAGNGTTITNTPTGTTKEWTCNKWYVDEPLHILKLMKLYKKNNFLPKWVPFWLALLRPTPTSLYSKSMSRRCVANCKSHVVPGTQKNPTSQISMLFFSVGLLWPGNIKQLLRLQVLQQVHLQHQEADISSHWWQVWGIYDGTQLGKGNNNSKTNKPLNSTAKNVRTTAIQKPQKQKKKSMYKRRQK